jgi:hypothetical protein
MDLESLCLETATNTKAIGKKIGGMDMVKSHSNQEPFTKENGKTIDSMEKELSNKQMELSMMENGKTTRCMVKVK